MERYARLYRFSQADYEDVSSRLRQLERMMKEYDVGSADELIALAREQVGEGAVGREVGEGAVGREVGERAVGCEVGAAVFFLLLRLQRFRFPLSVCEMLGASVWSTASPMNLEPHSPLKKRRTKRGGKKMPQESQLDRYFQYEGQREEMMADARDVAQRAQRVALVLSRARRNAAEALGSAVSQ